MSLAAFYQQFVTDIQHTKPLEFIAVLFGVVSVLCSRKENIWVYPTGIVNTVLYTWFCFSWWSLYAEGSLNFYYTIMSIYGWVVWSKQTNGAVLPITYNTRKDWQISLAFFVISWAVLFVILKKYTNSNVPWGDSFASATAYTGMWQMARKKVENWVWWILTNTASIPLYFYKHAAFTSIQYLVFLALAIAGLIEWRKKAFAYATKSS